MATNEQPAEGPPPALPAIGLAPEENPAERAKPVPNAKPRPATTYDDTYVYTDYAQASIESLDKATSHKKVPPACLQAQKLPSKMAVMLVDPDLMQIISWLPHGRSWKIYNRDLFTEIALPRYFGHKNYASFVRIVNAWGFRRVTGGLDRDSYYHELFLRGKPELHQRMKRLPTTHRKTPINKEFKTPDFYELSKVSPLPEVTLRPKPPAPTMYTGSLHPIGGGYLPAAAVPPAGAATATAAATVGTNVEGDNADSKDKKDDTAAMLEQNMRLSNELLRRQLLELQQRENGGVPSIPGQQPAIPITAAEAEARMNHQLMQLQRERFMQVQQEKEKAESESQKMEAGPATGGVTNEEKNEDEAKSDDAKVSPMVKDLIARYNKDKDTSVDV